MVAQSLKKYDFSECSLCVRGILKGIENLLECNNLLGFLFKCSPNYTIRLSKIKIRTRSGQTGTESVTLCCNRKKKKKRTPYDAALTPFPSFFCSSYFFNTCGSTASFAVLILKKISAGCKTHIIYFDRFIGEILRSSNYIQLHAVCVASCNVHFGVSLNKTTLEFNRRKSPKKNNME